MQDVISNSESRPLPNLVPVFVPHLHPVPGLLPELIASIETLKRHFRPLPTVAWIKKEADVTGFRGWEMAIIRLGQLIERTAVALSQGKVRQATEIWSKKEMLTKARMSCSEGIFSKAAHRKSKRRLTLRHSFLRSHRFRICKNSESALGSEGKIVGHTHRFPQLPS